MFSKNKKGIMLIACYLVIVVLSILGSVFLTASITEKKVAEREIDSIQAFYLAEAGIDRVASELYTIFRSHFNDPLNPDRRTAQAFNWFNNLAVNYLPPNNAPLGQGTYSVVIAGVDWCPLEGRADITLVSTGDANNTNRIVRSVIHYYLAPSRVFEHPYFVNNFGWFGGGGITANGDIRSNGNFSFGGNPTVNGDIYASVNPDLGANGDITGNSRNDSIPHYRNHADDEARPTNPTADPEDVNGNGILDPGEDTNGNGILDDFDYPNGYDNEDINGNGILDPGEDTNGNGILDGSVRFPNQDVLEMPSLGNLQTYRNLAVNEGGSISQGGVVLVNGVYGDDAAEVGPDGIGATPDDGCMVLVGTAASPVVINGPVVIEGDVIIRGIVRGQGIIYSGRNTHIIGNITYQNPPAWPKPDTDPGTTDIINNGEDVNGNGILDAGEDVNGNGILDPGRDFLGLAARGNVIVGDYTRTDWRHVTNYLRPPFTQGYEIDPADADIGYDTNPDPGVFSFNGNYTVPDGGDKDDGAGGVVNRRYYESSLSDNFIHGIAAASNQIRRVDAVAYTNHAFAGRVGAFSVNGNLICRDEAIVYSGHITMNYDLRAKTRGVDFHLPGGELASPDTISWEEN